MNLTSNITNQAEEEKLKYYAGIYHSFHNSYIWVLAALGVPGNIACLLTLTSMTMTTSIFYVTLLAGTDLLALVLKIIFHQLSNHSIPLYDVGCKLGSFVEVVSCYANWTLVLICFERFLAVCYPLKRNAYFTEARAVAIAAIIAIIIFLCYLYAIILYQFDPDKLCGFFNGPPGFTQYWIWTATILYSLLPFVLLAVLTVFIIHSLRKHFRSRHTLQATSGVEQSFSRAEFSICVMMVAAAVVFLFLTLPSCLFFVLSEAQVLGYDSTDLQIISVLMAEFSTELADSNHAINFYIYFLTNGRFRARFKALVQRGFKKVPESTVDYRSKITILQRSLEHLNTAKL
ncbi:hypothetical protein C0Q70_09145 [Pomacea canaliculata]|uniref:G-protein coupled receptors family 1 profile domain-containing protein n=1 Tax=Pomacea canaliculata TaxID=400727 RepID=A0A2T7P8Z5_POMCA|nr:FMRFamide receptor-like isoform X1 [Pomacea canaliculata]XP_025095717.1 FMRFamide receptor-like isoform X1 [Pomacea canaliculata]PVD29888.1 hypothetical protein C0Q70_09145 [Pomacea canaliculata]